MKKISNQKYIYKIQKKDIKSEIYIHIYIYKKKNTMETRSSLGWE